MPSIAISVDCEAANVGRCYTKEIIAIAEEFTVPLTWLIYVSEKDPLSNLDLYRNEFFHRIPSWHEIGLLVKFENSAGYIADHKQRGDLIRIAKDSIKSRHIKPTAFRAHGFDLYPSDLIDLEDIGIIVDGSTCPGAQDKDGVTHPKSPVQPYHPAYGDLSVEGASKITIAPVATHNGVCGCLDLPWDTVRPVMDHGISGGGFVHLCMTDTVDNTETLRSALAYAKGRKSRFLTMTQISGG